MRKRKQVSLIISFMMMVCLCCFPAFAQEEAAAESRAFDLTAIVEFVVTAIGFVITAYLVPWLKSRTTNETQARIGSYVSIAVHAAEQLYGAGEGEKKLRYAENWLKEKNIRVDTATLRAMIENEVYYIRNQFAPMQLSDAVDSDEGASTGDDEDNEEGSI